MKIRFSLFSFSSRIFHRAVVVMLFILAWTALTSDSTRAAVTVVSYWHLGENDPGAAPHDSATNIMDSVGSHNLVVSGSASYLLDASSAAHLSASSVLSADFENSAFASNAIVSSVVDNFGIEAWVRPKFTNAGQVIIYNGSTATSGWGLIISATGLYNGLFGGKDVFGTSHAIPGVWTHVALVRSNGTALLYVNGVSAGSSLVLPNTPVGDFAMAAPPQSPTSQFFSGEVDEARVFTFGSGQFSTNDLLLNRTNYTLGLSSRLEGPDAGSDSVVLNVFPYSASWTVSTNAPWLHLSAPNLSGAGSATIVFSYDANPGATRSGILSIGGQNLAITQAGSNYVAARPITTLAHGIYPAGVVVDKSGNVIYSDRGLNAVNEWVAATGAVNSLITGLSGPAGVAVDAYGNIFLADYSRAVIEERFAADGSVTNLVTSGFTYPNGVGVDSSGNLYITDSTQRALKELQYATGVVTNLLTSGLADPNCVTVDFAGNVYFIDDTSPGSVLEWVAASNTVTTVVGGFSYPYGVAVDGSGDVYIGAEFDFSVRKWSAATHAETTLVNSGTYEEGVAVDSNRNVYYAATLSGTVNELPYAFVDPTPKTELLTPGVDTLPMVLPATENLTGPFTPTSDQPWLTITGVTNGVVSFSFTATSTARQAHINLLGQSIPVTQGNLAAPVLLTSVQLLASNIFTFNFTNFPGTTFEVLTSTDVTQPLSQWTSLGPPSNTAPGQFQFTSPPNPGDTHRYYTIRSP